MAEGLEERLIGRTATALAAMREAESGESVLSSVRPIETRYRGYRFRSRLEARWAVYFDAAGLAWEYEPEGYRLPSGDAYLPDFWLPGVESWAEVKPVAFTRRELRRCADLVDATGRPCVLLVGMPTTQPVPILAVTAGQCAHRHGGLVQGDDAVPGFVSICDAVLDATYVDERRWFVCCGGLDMGHLRPYVQAARSARFEYGESGAR